MPQIAPIVGSIALNLAFGVGASIVADWLRPKQAERTVAARTSRGISFEISVGEQVPVSSLFGRGRVRSHLVFAQEYGANNEYCKFVYAEGKTPSRYDGFEALLLDEVPRALSGSNSDTHGKVVDDYVVSGTPHAWWKVYDGAAGQTADAGLIAAAPTRWTTDHTGVGTPYGILTIRQNPDLFGGTLPRKGSVWRGNRLYDWRFDDTMTGGEGDQRWADPATWAWSENPAVCKWNFRRGLWINGVRVIGMGFSQYAQDLAYYTAAANLSDETIDFGEWEGPRYAFGREISDDEEQLEVLREFDRAMCGTSFDRGGADAPLPAQQLVAGMTLTDGHLLEDHGRVLDRYGTVSEKRTAYHGQFVDQAQDWAVRPYGTQIDAGLETLIGGRKLQPYDQLFEYRPERAQTRAQIELRKNLYPARATETFGPGTNVLEPGDAIERDMAEPGWGTMLGVVEKIVPLEGRMGNTITWRQWDNSIVPTSFGFIGPTTSPGTPPVGASRTLAVSGFDVVPYPRAGGGGEKPYGRAVWTPITDPNVKQVLITFWPAAGDPETDAESVPADARLVSARLFGPLAPETDYVAIAQPLRDDGRTTFPTSEVEFTSGAEIAAADSVSIAALTAALAKDVREQMGRTRALIEQFNQLGTLLEAVDRENFQLRNSLVRDISVQLGDLSASFTEVIEVALGPGGAIATALASLYAAMGGNDAAVNIRWTAVAAPSGYAARYAVTAEVNDGQQRGATFFIDVPANPAEPTRIGFMAGQTVFFTSGGDPIALIDENGFLKSANGVYSLNLFTGAESITVTTP